MQTNQRKAGNTVGENNILPPPLLIMATLALLTLLTVMDIIVHMACQAVLGQFLAIQFAWMTTQAIHFFVQAVKNEFRVLVMGEPDI